MKDNQLNEQINRYNAINNYQDVILKETQYKFYNELNEVVPNQSQSMDDPNNQEMQPPQAENDPNNMDDVIEPSDNMQDFNSNIPEPEPNGEEIETGGDPNSEEMQNIPEPNVPEEINDDEPIEIDITSLVDKTDEVKQQLLNFEANFAKMDNIINAVNNIDTKLNDMDVLINRLDSLAKQVELMRPPTEMERREVLKNNSYPYSLTPKDFSENGDRENQTNMEDKSKMSIYDTIMNKYNDVDIKKSFNVPNENPFNKEQLN